MVKCKFLFFADSFRLTITGSLKRESSKWFAYIASLPDGIIPLPVFWHLDEQDGTTALLWLRGTEPGRLLCAQVGDDGKSRLVCRFQPYLNFLTRTGCNPELLSPSGVSIPPWNTPKGGDGPRVFTQPLWLLSSVFLGVIPCIPGRCVSWVGHGPSGRCVCGQNPFLEGCSVHNIASIMLWKTMFISRSVRFVQF